MGHVHKLLGIALAVATLALMAQVSETVAEMAAGPSLTVSGKIASIDPLQKVFKLKTGIFWSKQFVVESDTKISDGQQSLTLEQLQPGAKATVEYIQEDGKQVAQSITLESAAGAPQEAPRELDRAQSPTGGAEPSAGLESPGAPSAPAPSQMPGATESPDSSALQQEPSPESAQPGQL